MEGFIQNNYYSKSYFNYLSKLVDQHNNIYHRSIRKTYIDDDYSALTKKAKLSHKTSKFKVDDRVRITKYKNIFSAGCIGNCSIEIFVILCWKLIHGHVKLNI